MSDAINWEDIRSAMRMLEGAPPPPNRLKYFATPAEMANAVWVERFKYNFPTVDLVEVQPIPRD